MNSHARFVNLIETLDSFKELTPSEYFLINKLTVVWQKKSQVSVKDILSIKDLGSRAKIHRDLTSLKKKGFITHKFNMDDQRIKYVIPKRKLELLIFDFEKALRLSQK